MRQDYWDKLCDIWADKNWEMRSKVASENRNSLEEDKVYHSCGSVSVNVHKKRMAIELGRNPTLKEVFDRTHKSKKTDTFVCPRAKSVSEAYDQRIREKYGDDISSQPELDSQAWLSASGGARKGRVYGFGGSVNSQSILGGTSCHESEAPPISSNASQIEIDDAFMTRLQEMVVKVATEVATKVYMQMRQEEQSTSQPSTSVPSSRIPPSGPTGSSRARTEQDGDEEDNTDGE